MTGLPPDEVRAIRRDAKAGAARASQDEDTRMPGEIRQLLDDNK